MTTSDMTSSDSMKLAWFEDGVIKSRQMTQEEWAAMQARKTAPLHSAAQIEPDFEWKDLHLTPFELMASLTPLRR